MARVWIPALLRNLVGGAETVEAAGRTVGEVIDSLEARHPGLKARLCPSGELEPWLLVSVDGAAAQRGLAEPVAADSEILFVPAISGGSRGRPEAAAPPPCLGPQATVGRRRRAIRGLPGAGTSRTLTPSDQRP